MTRCARLGKRTTSCMLLLTIMSYYGAMLSMRRNSLTFVSVDEEIVLLPNRRGSYPFLSENAVCTEVATRELEMVRHEDQYTNLKDFLVGPGLGVNSTSNKNQSVCYFFKTQQSKHFPHAMQQLYRCWSWWRATLLQSPSSFNTTFASQQAFLIGPTTHRGFRESAVQRKDFFTEMLHALSKQVGVEILAQNYSTDKDDQLAVLMQRRDHEGSAAVAKSSFMNGDGFALQTAAHARQLREILLGRLSPNSLDRDWATGCPTSKHLEYPRISILNRDVTSSKRSFVNAHVLAKALEKAFTNESSGSQRTIPVKYFENSTFYEQIQFFDENDIIVSPHGAQLTGIPFMPSCGVIMEFFPTGYYMPFYFRSLAKAAGIAYSAMYVSTQGDWERENAATMLSVHTRFRARQQNLCPKVDDVFGAVQRIVDVWYECCNLHRRRNRQFSG